MSRSAPKPEPFSVLVPQDTILDSGRVLRRPLGEWASELTKLIQASENPTDLETVGRGCSALNNAALVFAHAGQAALAGEICRMQLSWLESFQGVMRDDELSVHSIHPWVNLGRLCRRAGDYDGAAAYFRTLKCKGDGEEFRQSAEPLYVYETLRNYLQSGNLDGAVDFAYDLETPLLTSSQMLKTELLLHIALRRRETVRLLELLREVPWPQDAFGILAQYFYTALALDAGGHPAACSAALSRLGRQWLRYSKREELDSRDLRFGIELCRLANYLKRDDLLEELFMITSAMVLRARDVLFAQNLLVLTNQNCGCAATLEARKLCELVECSGYGASSPHSNGTVIELARLQGAISNLMDASQVEVVRAENSRLQLAIVHA